MFFYGKTLDILAPTEIGDKTLDILAPTEIGDKTDSEKGDIPKIVPKEGDIVFVTIKNLSIAGTYCDLLEYPNLEGFILNTELDRKVRDDKRQIRICDQRKFQFGTTYPALVLSVNKNGVDLSYKKIDIETREELIHKFGYVCKIKQLSDDFVTMSKLTKEIVYPLTIWKFVETDYVVSFNQKETFFSFLKNPENFCVHLLPTYPEIVQAFIDSVKGRTTYTTITVEQPFELTIFDVDGITKLKQVLNYVNTDPNINISVECVSSPTYKIITSCYTLDECNTNINNCFKEISTNALQFRSFVALKSRKNSDGVDDLNGIVKNQEIYIKPLPINVLKN